MDFITPQLQKPQYQVSMPELKHFMNKKFAITAIILILIAIIAYAGIWYWQKQQVAQQVVPTVTPRVIDETADWKTYTNTQYGFEFRYPSNWNFVNELGTICLRENGKHYPIEEGEVCGVSVFAYKTNPNQTSTADLIKNRTHDNPNLKVYNIQVSGINATRIMGYGDETYFDYKGNTYSISSQYDVLNLPNLKNILDQILSTFKFTK